MHRGSLFWGSAILIMGVLLLLNNMGLLSINVWGLIGPAFLILLGFWFLLGPLLHRRKEIENQLSIPLGRASSAEIKIRHGAGQLNIRSMTGTTNLLAGTFGGGVEYTTQDRGDSLQVLLQANQNLFWETPLGVDAHGLVWNISLLRDIPLTLNIHSGASESTLDLGDLQVKEFTLDTGASSNDIILPAAAGYTRASVKAGASSVKIRLPEGVAGRINVRGGLATINVNPSRFPQKDNHYETPGYENSPNKAEIVIETGVGSVEVS